jgi:hypothetical protein
MSSNPIFMPEVELYSVSFSHNPISTEGKNIGFAKYMKVANINLEII